MATRRAVRPVDLSGYDDPDDGTDEPVRPRPAVRRRQADADEPVGRTRPRPRPVDGDDDDDDEPRGRGRGKDREPPAKVDTSGGWGKLRKEKTRRSEYPDRFKPEEKETYLIKFLEDEPFAAYGQHWLEQITQGQRSFTCIADEYGEGCPLCDDLGHKARAMAHFNVVVYEEVKKGRNISLMPSVMVWETTPQVSGILSALSDEVRGLSNGYFTVYLTSTGKGRQKRNTWSIRPIKERDVEEDWEAAEVLTEEDIEEFEALMKDDSVIEKPSRSDLRDVVRSVQAMED